MSQESDWKARYKAQVQRLRRQLSKAERERDQALGTLDEVATDLEGLPDASELEAENTRLKGEIKGDRYRRVFNETAKELKVKGDALDDLWKLAEIEQKDEQPDPKAIRAAVKEATKKRTWMLDQTDEESNLSDEEGGQEGATEGGEKPAKSEPPLSRGEGAGQGKAPRGPSGHYNVRRSDLSNPEWMRNNGDKFAAAVDSGTVNYVN